MKILIQEMTNEIQTPMLLFFREKFTMLANGIVVWCQPTTNCRNEKYCDKEVSEEIFFISSSIL